MIVSHDEQHYMEHMYRRCKRTWHTLNVSTNNPTGWRLYVSCFIWKKMNEWINGCLACFFFCCFCWKNFFLLLIPKHLMQQEEECFFFWPNSIWLMMMMMRLTFDTDIDFKCWKIQKFLPMKVMEKNNNAEKAKGYDWNTG